MEREDVAAGWRRETWEDGVCERSVMRYYAGIKRGNPDGKYRANVRVYRVYNTQTGPVSCIYHADEDIRYRSYMRPPFYFSFSLQILYCSAMHRVSSPVAMVPAVPPGCY
jgi:hypothetical protein